MAKSTKISISLSAELLRDIEQEHRASGESRSEFFRRAVQAYLRQEREREVVQQYIQGYQKDPETAEEVGLAQSTTQSALAEHPWAKSSSEQ